MKKRFVLIFDFDGTIANTKDLYYKTIFDEIKSFGYTKNQIEEAIEFGLNLRRTLRKLGFGWLISWFVKNKIMKKVLSEAEKIKKCKDVDEIKKIDKKIKKILITNSLKQFAVPILKHLKLKKYFPEIYGAEDFEDKAEFIKSYLIKNKINRKNCYYIGDRVADVEVAKKGGCKSIIVSNRCSWDSRKEIIKAGPDFIISDLAEIKEIVK